MVSPAWASPSAAVSRFFAVAGVAPSLASLPWLASAYQVLPTDDGATSGTVLSKTGHGKVTPPNGVPEPPPPPPPETTVISLLSAISATTDKSGLTAISDCATAMSATVDRSEGISPT